MGFFRDKIFEHQIKAKRAKLSDEVNHYVDMLDNPALKPKLEASPKLEELCKGLMTLSELQLKRATRGLDQRTSEMLEQMGKQPNLYEQMRAQEKEGERKK